MTKTRKTRKAAKTDQAPVRGRLRPIDATLSAEVALFVQEFGKRHGVEFTWCQIGIVIRDQPGPRMIMVLPRSRAEAEQAREVK